MKLRHVGVCAFLISLCGISGVAQQNTAANPNRSSAPPPATVTGSGTSDYVPLWTGSSTLGKSRLYQTGGLVGVGTTSPSVTLDVNGRINSSRSYRLQNFDVLVVPGPEVSTGNTGVGVSALGVVTTGSDNTGVGYGALSNIVTSEANTAVGTDALALNTADANTALGHGAMLTNSIGTQDVATGVSALFSNTSGNNDTATGNFALFNNITGSNNTALGYSALKNNLGGNGNIAIGNLAAVNVAGGSSNNIHIGSRGVSTDKSTIRIGATGTQTSFFVVGVRGVTTGLNDAVPVVISSNGQLGTVSSSRRFKEDIRDMGEASHDLMRLRPVTFRYTKAFDDGSKPMQYGLVAEEVEQVYPDLVARSEDGQVETVKYQVLDSMLLNEVQRQQAEIKSLQERLARLEARVGVQVARRPMSDKRRLAHIGRIRVPEPRATGCDRDCGGCSLRYRRRLRG